MVRLSRHVTLLRFMRRFFFATKWKQRIRPHVLPYYRNFKPKKHGDVSTASIQSKKHRKRPRAPNKIASCSSEQLADFYCCMAVTTKRSS